MSQFVTVKAEVEDEVGRHNSEFTSQIGKFINNVCQDVCDEMNFWFMKRTWTYDILSTDSPAQYDLSELLKEPVTAYLQLTESYKELEIVPVIDAIRRFPPSPTAAQPSSVVIENNVMTVIPPPDGSYTLRLLGWSRFEELVADEDTNFLLSFKKKLVVAGAVMKSFSFLQEYADAEYWKREFKEHLILLRREHNSRTLPGKISLIPKSDVFAANSDSRLRAGTIPPSGYY